MTVMTTCGGFELGCDGGTFHALIPFILVIPVIPLTSLLEHYCNDDNYNDLSCNDRTMMSPL